MVVQMQIPYFNPVKIRCFLYSQQEKRKKSKGNSWIHQMKLNFKLLNITPVISELDSDCNYRNPNKRLLYEYLLLLLILCRPRMTLATQTVYVREIEGNQRNFKSWRDNFSANSF